MRTQCVPHKKLSPIVSWGSAANSGRLYLGYDLREIKTQLPYVISDTPTPVSSSSVKAGGADEGEPFGLVLG